MLIFRAATWTFSGGWLLQQSEFLKWDGRATLAGRTMSLLLSFMHYVCYIMSVPLCTEESEPSQKVWLILFLCTLAVGSLVMLVCQGHRSRLYQDFFTTDTRSLLFICPYGHVFFLMTDRAADGQEIFFF